MVLVGTKMDSRDSYAGDGQGVVSHEQGMQLMRDISASKYIECSAVTRSGLREIFEEAARVVMFPGDKKERRKGSEGSMHYCQSPCNFL